MELVISALKRQLRIEEIRQQERETMMANANTVLYAKPLPDTNPEYAKQIRSVLAKLKWNTEAIALLSEIQQLHKGDDIGDKITAKLIEFTKLI